MTILEDVNANVAEAMRTIDGLELYRHKVYILTRTWSGDRVGRGSKTDEQVQVYPTPYMKDYSHDLRVREGGNIRAGDVIIKYIPKEDYAEESLLDCSTSAKNIEKFYVINNRIYNVVSVLEGYVYWNVHLRKTNQEL
jgi:hypothetical protein